MRAIPFGASLAQIIAGVARLAITPSNVLWHVPKTEDVHYNGRRYKVGRAHGYNHGRDYSHARNGERECARRRRQIERGQLRVENGLDPLTV